MASNGKPTTLPEQETKAPHSIEAEQAFLGGYITCKGADINVRLQPKDFYLLRHEYIWRAIQAIRARNESPDYLNIAMELKTQEKLGLIGGIVYISDMVINPPPPGQTEHYGKMIHRLARRRGMLDAADEIKRLACDEEQSLELAAGCAEQALFMVTEQINHHKENSASESIHNARALLAERQAMHRVNPHYVLGLRTGFPSLDKLLDGLRRGDVTVWAGITGSGKTALFLTAMLYQAQKGIFHREVKPAKIAWFSGEMGEDVVNNRLAAIFSNVPVRKIERGNLNDKEAARVKVAHDTIEKLDITSSDASRITPSELKSWLRRLKQQDRVDIVWLDGLKQIEHDRHDNEMYVRLANTMVQLEGIAKELDISVNVTHQLSRAPRSRLDNRPQLSDLGWSSGIEESAARVLMLHRPHIFDDNVAESIAEIYVRKNRHGQTGMIPLTFYPNWTTFREGIGTKQVIDLASVKPTTGGEG